MANKILIIDPLMTSLIYIIPRERRGGRAGDDWVDEMAHEVHEVKSKDEAGSHRTPDRRDLSSHASPGRSKRSPF